MPQYTYIDVADQIKNNALSRNLRFAAVRVLSVRKMSNGCC